MRKEENLHWLDVEIQTWENECQSKHPIKEALYAARKALEKEPCEDAVSRKSVIAIIQNHWWNCRDIDKLVNELPPVTPQEPRKGHWIVNKWGNISCSECGCNALYDKVYTDNSPSGKAVRIKSTVCPTCGAYMRV